VHLWLTVEGEAVRLSSGYTIVILVGALYGVLRMIWDIAKMLGVAVMAVWRTLPRRTYPEPPSLEQVQIMARERSKRRRGEPLD
jgi:hypothetical protein